MQERWTKEDSIGFAIASAMEAIDQACDYQTINEAIEQYCFNLQDTLDEHGASDCFFEALESYKSQINMLIGYATTAKI